MVTIHETIQIQGFTIGPANAAWVTCDRCGESELVYGSHLVTDSLTWARAHLTETHPAALGEREDHEHRHDHEHEPTP